MPEIEIDEAQAAYLEELREALATVHLEEYGAMRTRDALQYLIDRHEGLRDTASLVDAVGAAGDAAESLVDDAAVEDAESAGRGDEDGGDESADDEGAEDEAVDADDDESPNGDDDADAGSSSPLQRMMRLLDEHDDVWEEVDSSDGKYAVTLPDGSTEHARTQDDVRALLFKHYR